jgi:pimeloyl-ACP methyl ester carboxylesterase
MEYKTIETPILEIAYFEYGPQDGWPVILSHGFPYDVHAYDEVARILEKSGARVIVPYLRGFGPTRFKSPATTTPRSCQQAALGSDLISLLNALNIDKAILAGFDWGGLASCAATVLCTMCITELLVKPLMIQSSNMSNGINTFSKANEDEDA